MTAPKIRSVTKAMTPVELFRIQVQNVYDHLRAENDGQKHIPASMGGIGGQRQLITEKNVLDITEIRS